MTSMNLALSVAGKFTNGMTRIAELNWTYGMPFDETGELKPPFKRRAELYRKAYKREIAEAPKRGDGLPRFEYMAITYFRTTAAGQTVTGRLYVALTPKGLERVASSTQGKSVNFDDIDARLKFMQGGQICVVDMTRCRNATVFWTKFEQYVDFMYRTVFGVGQ